MKGRKQLSPFEKLVRRIENAAYDAKLELNSILEIKQREINQEETCFLLGYLYAHNKLLAFANSVSRFPEQEVSFPATLDEWRAYFEKKKDEP